MLNLQQMLQHAHDARVQLMKLLPIKKVEKKKWGEIPPSQKGWIRVLNGNPYWLKDDDVVELYIV